MSRMLNMDLRLQASRASDKSKYHSDLLNIEWKVCNCSASADITTSISYVARPTPYRLLANDPTTMNGMEASRRADVTNLNTRSELIEGLVAKDLAGGPGVIVRS